jgi:hypothetical protein
MINRCLTVLAHPFSLAAFSPAALLVVAMCALAGCASEPAQKDQQLRKSDKAKASVEVQEPSAEELAGSPCGNPDWAQVPAGAEPKIPNQRPDSAPGMDQEDTDQKDTDQKDTDQKDINKQDTKEQSSRGGQSLDDPSPDDQPCT